ncbi:MAG: anti-sigma factor [Alphaproteobacteria bacterium]|jgi:anti-sigma factor RsiW|nr:MAG: anti-sigma factor [Alphaproteobacteria bacterium]
MTTSTTDPRLLVHAYVDGELDPANALELERQLANDPALAAERERIEALRRTIAERLPREAAPAGLARRIEAAVGARPAPARIAAHPSWRALAASVMVAAFLGSGATWLALSPAPADADMVVANHVRALMAPHPVDVESSDGHTVKPWFSGRIPEAPRVVDLSNDGFALVGGRIDVIGRTPIPTLVYRVRQHLISVSALRAGRAAAMPNEQIAGYNLVSWTDNGVTYWAVSNVAAADLNAFVKAFRAAAPDGNT